MSAAIEEHSEATEQQPTSPPEGKSQRGDVIAGYVLAVVIPVFGVILGITITVREKYRDHTDAYRHGPWIILISVLAAIMWTVVIFTQSETGGGVNVQGDLQYVLNQNNVGYQSVDGCAHATGSQYLCTVTMNDGSRVTVTVTDDGHGYVYEQGIAAGQH